MKTSVSRKERLIVSAKEKQEMSGAATVLRVFAAPTTPSKTLQAM